MQARLVLLALMKLKPEDHKFGDNPDIYQVQGQPGLHSITLFQKEG